MANARLNISDLDFDQIKQNLKSYLQQQNTFQDYDFEGSGLSVLLDILAYNTHYNSYYLNMVANESFLDTAILRDSVVSHAKTLGYTPQSITAPEAVRSGLAFRTKKSACNKMASSNLSRFFLSFAETSMTIVSPPISSGTKP